jgi:hypothetical protein
MKPIPNDGDLQIEVLGGKPAVKADWPLSLQFTSEGRNCTSTVVGERVLLTAAHCVAHGAKGGAKFNAAWTEITCFHHPDYKGPSCLTATTSEEIAGCTADVALCRAETPFSLTTDSGDNLRLEFINRDPANVKLSANVTLLGYGCLKSGGPISEILHVGKATIKSLPLPRASSSLKNALQEYLLAEGQHAICQGDSGGAAFDRDVRGLRKIIGINSRGNIFNLSYLTSTSDKHIVSFLESWRDTPICGIHENAKGC